MINLNLIENKLANISQYLSELEQLVKKDITDILRDEVGLHAIERLFQLIVDTMVDINTHIIAEKNFRAPDDYQSTFITLAQNGVLPMEFALKIAPIVGMRNRIVHKYEDVDIKRFLAELQNENSDIKQFMKFIKEYLD